MKRAINIFVVLAVVILTSVIILTLYKYHKGKYESNDLSQFFENGKFGYIDKKGKIVIKPRFDDTLGFSEKLAGVKIGDKWGYIDKEGEIVIMPRFDDVEDFSEGLAGVKTGDKWSYIDKEGKMVKVINPQFAD